MAKREGTALEASQAPKMRMKIKKLLQVRVSNTVGDAVDTVGLGLSDELGHLVANCLAVLEGIVHALNDVRIELLVREVAEIDGAVNAILLGSTNDTAGDNNGDLADAADVRVQPAVGNLLLVEGCGKRLGGGVDHVLCDGCGLGENSAETDTGENVHVVALTRGEQLAIVLHGGEGRAGGEKTAALSVEDSLLECALRLAGGVGQGEDDGVIVQLGHLLENLLVESTANGGQTHQDGGLDVVDQAGERLVLTAVVVVASKVDLVLGELVTTVVGDETIRVDEPELAASLFLCQTLLLEELDNLLGDTNTGTASAEEDGLVILDGDTRRLDGVDEATNNDGASSLDVVVEHAVGVLVALESGEGVLEVLELNDDAVTRSVTALRT